MATYRASLLAAPGSQRGKSAPSAWTDGHDVALGDPRDSLQIVCGIQLHRASLAIEAAPAPLRLRVRFTVFADHVAHTSPRSGSPGESQQVTSTPFFPAGGAGRGISASAKATARPRRSATREGGPASPAGASPVTSAFGAEAKRGNPATGPGRRRQGAEGSGRGIRKAGGRRARRRAR